MKFDIEPQDIEAIAQRVSEIIKPMLTHHAGSNEKDTIFDVKGLAEYLCVDACWVYKQVSLRTIPFLKVGRYTRFRKRDIERWMESQARKPIPVLKVAKLRGVAS
ncbi:MAG: helix-turn-helix domain-containing protein [Alphaproteobacteria bacterium]